MRNRGTERRSARGFGPGEWLLLAVPILSGLRLSVTDMPDGDLSAAYLLVDMAGPGVALLALAIGACARLALPAELRDDPARLRLGSTLRMVAILVSAAIGLRLVFPVDLLTYNGPWRQMAGWTLGVALPVWASGLYALVSGRRTPGALVTALTWGLAPAVTALGFGYLYALPFGALVMPLTAGGLTAGAGLGLASWFGVAAPRWAVLAAASSVAVVPSWMVAHHHADVPLDTLDVASLVAFDPTHDRIAVQVGRADTLTYRLVEVQLPDGGVELLQPLDRNVVYAGGTRVTVRRRRWHQSTEIPRPRDLCRETAPGSRVMECRPGTLPTGRGVTLGRHPRAALALASIPDRIVVWDLEQDKITTHVEQSTIRWPCFQREASVLYRLKTAQGPYTQHSLDIASGATRVLEPSHDLQCAADIPVEPFARILRGRLNLERPTKLLAPSLPGGELVLDGTLTVATWSRDGSTLGLLFDQNEDNIRAFSDDWGFMPRLTVPTTPHITVNVDGTMLAYAVEIEKRWNIVVMELPSGKTLAQPVTSQHQMIWDGRGGLLYIVDRKLVRLDPRSGREDVLFPPPT